MHFLSFFVMANCFHREITSTVRQGYTKSVDMWSLGCVTVVILIGAPPFRKAESYSFSESQARQGDLDILRADPDWEKVGHRPKDFVYRLLVLDETQRMDAKTALQHAWFTNPTHKAEFDAVYRRAICDWKPRAVQEPVVVLIEEIFTAQPAVKLNQVTRSDSSLHLLSPDRQAIHFDSAHLKRSPSLETSSTDGSARSSTGEPTCQRLASPTLSDPDFPREARSCMQEDERVYAQEDEVCIINQNRDPEKWQDAKNCQSGNTTYLDNCRVPRPARHQSPRSRPRPRPRLPFSPLAWTWTGYGDRKGKQVAIRRQRPQKTVYKQHRETRTMIKETATNAGNITKQGQQADQSGNRNDKNNDNSYLAVLVRKRPIEEVYAVEGEEAEEKKEEEGEEDDGEVYEEVENPLSGKIYQIKYGTRLAGK